MAFPSSPEAVLQPVVGDAEEADAAEGALAPAAAEADPGPLRADGGEHPEEEQEASEEALPGRPGRTPQEPTAA